ncbi:MAG: anti-sigma factor domain-containing protein [Acidimicrobiales bacterium]
MSTHTEIEELLGVYVCDAVDPTERALVERHLLDCPKCRAEVAELREVTALLANAEAATPAPDGIWDRILASLEEAPPPLRLTVAPAPPEAATREQQPAANVVAIKRFDSRRWFGAMVAAAAAVIGIVGFSLGRSTSAPSPQAAGLQAAAFQALVEPGSRTAPLLDASEVKQAVAVVRANGEGYLIGDNLAVPSGRIYQLWGTTTDGAVVSLGILQKPGVIAFNVGDPTSVSAFMVTEELRPVDRTSNPSVVAGTLA